MPYTDISDLPDSVRGHLPRHAQEIFRAAFNSAWDEHADDDMAAREERAFRIAWAAVKRRYRKVGDAWEARD